MTFVISCFSTSFMDFNSSLRVFYSLVHWGYEQFTMPTVQFHISLNHNSSTNFVYFPRKSSSILIPFCMKTSGFLTFFFLICTFRHLNWQFAKIEERVRHISLRSHNQSQFIIKTKIADWSAMFIFFFISFCNWNKWIC